MNELTNSALPPIRVGAIGCGQFMSQQHIQTIGRSSRLRLEHLADIDGARLERVAGRYRPTRSSTRWEAVVEDPKVQVVVVGVVPTLHAQIARAALEHGKPVYVEKPLANTVAECQSIAELAQKTNLPVAIGFNRRFAPAVALLRKAFQSAAGPATAFYRMCDDDRVRPPEQQWKKADRLLIEVVHIFDLLSFLFDSQPVSVFAREARFNDATIVLSFANGSQGVIVSSSYGSLAQPKEHMEVILDHATIEMDDYVEVRACGLPGIAPVTYFAGRLYDDADNSHVADFGARGLAALREFRQRYNEVLSRSGALANSGDRSAWERFRNLLGTPPLPQVNYAADKGWGSALENFCAAAMEGRRAGNATVADGNRATACAVAARKSSETGRPVALDPRTWTA